MAAVFTIPVLCNRRDRLAMGTGGAAAEGYAAPASADRTGGDNGDMDRVVDGAARTPRKGFPRRRALQVCARISRRCSAGACRASWGIFEWSKRSFLSRQKSFRLPVHSAWYRLERKMAPELTRAFRARSAVLPAHESAGVRIVLMFMGRLRVILLLRMSLLGWLLLCELFA